MPTHAVPHKPSVVRSILLSDLCCTYHLGLNDVLTPDTLTLKEENVTVRVGLEEENVDI